MAKHIYEQDLNFNVFVEDNLWHIEDAVIDWEKKEVRVQITISDQFGTLSLFQIFSDQDFYDFVNDNAIDRISFLKRKIDFESLSKQHKEKYEAELDNYKTRLDLDLNDDNEDFIRDAEAFLEEMKDKLLKMKGINEMSKLPDVYEVHDIDGYGVVYIGGGRYQSCKDTSATWLLLDDAESVQHIMNNGAESEDRFRMYFNGRFLSPDREFYMIRKVDEQDVR